MFGRHNKGLRKKKKRGAGKVQPGHPEYIIFAELSLLPFLSSLDKQQVWIYVDLLALSGETEEEKPRSSLLVSVDWSNGE